MERKPHDHHQLQEIERLSREEQELLRAEQQLTVERTALEESLADALKQMKEAQERFDQSIQHLSHAADAEQSDDISVELGEEPSFFTTEQAELSAAVDVVTAIKNQMDINRSQMHWVKQKLIENAAASNTLMTATFGDTKNDIS